MARSRMIATVAGALIAVAAVTWAAVTLGGGRPYVIHADFPNAGRLVSGGQVRIGGVPVGKVLGIGLTPDGSARADLQIDDPHARPLPQGTTASIRAVGLATVANNYVELSPGRAGAPALPDGATLPPAKTTGIVDIDALLDTFTPPVRAQLRRLIAESSEIFAGSGSRQFNTLLARLDPAAENLTDLLGQLNSDQAQLGHLITTASKVAQVIDSQRPALVGAVVHTASAFSALAQERASLQAALSGAPALLRQGTTTLNDASVTFAHLRPALRLLVPAAARLGPVLGGLEQFLPRAQTVSAQLAEQLPALRQSLAELPAFAPRAVDALGATGHAFAVARPILRGFRFYAPDFLIGILNGLLTIGSGNYNKYGHYIHVSFVESPQELLGGALSGLLQSHPLVPGLFAEQTGITALCPGGANPPAPDHSNPWIPDRSLCDPKQDYPLSIDYPPSP